MAPRAAKAACCPAAGRPRAPHCCPCSRDQSAAAEPRARLAFLMGELLLSLATRSPAFTAALSSQLQRFLSAALPPPAAAAAAGGVSAPPQDWAEQGPEGLLAEAAAGRGAGLLAAGAVVQGERGPGMAGWCSPGRAWRAMGQQGGWSDAETLQKLRARPSRNPCPQNVPLVPLAVPFPPAGLTRLLALPLPPGAQLLPAPLSSALAARCLELAKALPAAGASPQQQAAANGGGRAGRAGRGGELRVRWQLGQM